MYSAYNVYTFYCMFIYGLFLDEIILSYFSLRISTKLERVKVKSRDSFLP